MTSGNK